MSTAQASGVNPSSSFLFVLEHTAGPLRLPNKVFLHWIVQAISQAYWVCGIPSPLGIRAQSTRGVASFKAFLSCASLQDVCDTVVWVSPHTSLNLFIFFFFLVWMWVHQAFRSLPTKFVYQRFHFFKGQAFFQYGIVGHSRSHDINIQTQRWVSSDMQEHVFAIVPACPSTFLQPIRSWWCLMQAPFYSHMVCHFTSYDYHRPTELVWFHTCFKNLVAFS